MVPNELKVALILFALFQIKHMLADFFLQTPRMLSGRAAYLHMGRAQHAGLHAAATVVVLALVGIPLWFIAVIAVAEWAVHFHIDWGKAAYSELRGYTPADAKFWRAVGFDQALHQLTYVAIIWAWALVV